MQISLAMKFRICIVQLFHYKQSLHNNITIDGKSQCIMLLCTSDTTQNAVKLLVVDLIISKVTVTAFNLKRFWLLEEISKCFKTK